MPENDKRPTAPERDRSPDGGKDLLNQPTLIQTAQHPDHKDHDAFEKTATLIATVNVPLSKRTDLELLPSERPDTPEHWIGNYAIGMASVGDLTQQQAIDGIRAAFENKYGMTPEAYAEGYVPDQKNAFGDGMERAVKVAARKEAERGQQRDRDRDRT